MLFFLGIVLASFLVVLVITRLAKSSVKFTLVEPDHDRRLLLEFHQIGGQPKVLTREQLFLLAQDFPQLVQSSGFP